MKLIIRFFLSLCILLFGGYGNAHAAKHVARPYHQPVLKQQEKAAAAAAETSSSIGFRPHNGDLVIKYAPTCTESYKEKMEVTDSEDDEEEDELVSLEKYLSPANYFTNLYCSPASGHFFSPVNNRIPFCEHSSLCSSDRCILLCVIRI